MNKQKLEQSLKAHESVCEMLNFAYLSEQMERQLLNLKRLLELEISALKAEEAKQDGNGDGAAA